jgi:RNA polymerase sigma-70 factor, ECF subfamily
MTGLEKWERCLWRTGAKRRIGARQGIMGNSSREIDERRLIREVADGDINAFSPLVERYKHHVARIVSRHVPRDVVEDVSQESFLRACRGLGGFDGSKPFEHWLSRITVRCCCDYWRNKGNSHETPISALAEDCQGFVDRMTADKGREAYEREEEKREALKLLNWALNHLGAEDRTVLTLTYLDGYSVAEAAELMGISQANVKVRAFRSRKKLRNVLEKAMEGER